MSLRWTTTAFLKTSVSPFSCLRAMRDISLLMAVARFSMVRIVEADSWAKARRFVTIFDKRCVNAYAVLNMLALTDSPADVVRRRRRQPRGQRRSVVLQ